MIGRTVSHYYILEKLGQGGIGVVYKAKETKLDREVALKFLPSNSITTKEDKIRFEQEAKAAARINHSNIAHVYEINEQEGETFIAMEYVDGETLSEMIERGPLKLADAIKIAAEISAGLQAAHEKKIIHRDIKSANIMLTSSGVVKIMDFGLAKLSGRTMVTREGTTLGTASYMSPEQARGDPADHRSDIWSLGVVFYEMNCGQLPFKGDYEQAVVYAILNEDPEPLTALRSGVPMALDGIIAKALAKDPATRYQHVDELPADLKGIDTNATTVSRTRESNRLTGPQAGKYSLGHKLGWVAALVVGLITGGAAIWLALRPAPPTTLRWNISTPDSAPISPIGSAPLAVGRPALTISPDGSKIVYAGEMNGNTQLYLRQQDRFEVTPIPDTEGAYHPFFAPDGIWVGFFVGNQLKKISLAGGGAVPLCTVTNTHGAAWGNANRIVYAAHEGSTLWWINDSGGTPRLIADESDGFFSWPEFLPDGDNVIVTDDTGKLQVVSVATGQIETLSVSGNDAKYIANEFLVFNNDGRLEGIRFDADRQEVIGNPVPLLDGVRTESLGWASQYAISRSGTLVYLPGAFEQRSNRFGATGRVMRRNYPIPRKSMAIFSFLPIVKNLPLRYFKAMNPMSGFMILPENLALCSPCRGPIPTRSGLRMERALLSLQIGPENGPFMSNRPNAKGMQD